MIGIIKQSPIYDLGIRIVAAGLVFCSLGVTKLRELPYHVGTRRKYHLHGC